MLMRLTALARCAVAPARERGLKSSTFLVDNISAQVAPARERGLKCQIGEESAYQQKSLPRGSVD